MALEFLEEVGEAVESFVDLLHAGGEGEADVGVEAGVVAGDDGDVVGFEESGGEGDGVGDLGGADGSSEVGGDVGEAIEGALGFDAGDVWEVGEALVHVAASFFEFGAHGIDGFFAAGVGEGGDGGHLREAGDVAGHLGLEFIDGVDDGLGAADVADAPAGHGEGFGVAVEGEGLVEELGVEGGEGDELEAVVDEFFVDFVGEDDEVGVFDDDVGEGF